MIRFNPHKPHKVIPQAQAVPPCLGCLLRHVGCHSECEKYAIYLAKHEAEKEYIHQQKMKEHPGQPEYTKRRYREMRKGNRTKI